MLLQNNVLTFDGSSFGQQPQSFSDSVASAREAFGQGRVTEQILEEAIARVEDIVMPMLRVLPDSGTLSVSGAELAAVLQLLPADGRNTSVQSVEHLFNQLADHAAGSVVAWRQPVEAAQVALALVVLREVMHHGAFQTVSLQGAAG